MEAAALPAAVIFDIDGVLLDSAECHRRAWHVLARELNVPFSDSLFWETFGQTNTTILPRLLGRELDPGENQRISERKEELFRMEARGRMALLPGIEETLRRLKAAGFRLALGSSAPRSNVEFFLDELGLGRHVTTYACMEDLRRGKPDPEVFLVAAGRLGVPPVRCVVVEDALPGVSAAKAAGMACVAVATTNSADMLREKARPDRILPGAADLMPETVAGLLAGREPVRRTARWSREDAWTYVRRAGPVRGCNYLPRTAVNATEMWQGETFDPKTIEQELSWARDLGYSGVRVFLSYVVWKQDPDEFKSRLRHFLAIASSLDIRSMPVLFDDCAFAGKEPHLGPQGDPVPGVHNSGWTPSPGLKLVVDRSAWPDLKRYVKDIVGEFALDWRIFAWDLYNEPGNSDMGAKSLPLLEASFGWARDAAPSQPLTSGPWADFASDLSRRQMDLSDVVSFHAYDAPAGVQGKIELCRAHGRPLLCTEWLHRASGNTFDAMLPLFAREETGWYHWGLVAGRTQTYLPWGSKPGSPPPALWQHDVLRDDGTPYDPAEMAILRRAVTEGVS